MFLNPNIFSNLNSNCSNLLDMRNLQEQVKKHSVAKNCSDLLLFEQIDLVFSTFSQILSLQPQISKVLKFQAEDRESAKKTSERSEQVFVTECFLTCS